MPYLSFRLRHWLLAFVLPLLFSGCLKDECRNRYTIYRPVFKSLSQVRAAMRFEAPRPVAKPGKLYLYGKYLLLNDVGRGIHVFDNANPAAPRKLGFLNITGNVDMAIRKDVLYADSYGDLAVIPIADWATAKPVAFRNRVFADRNLYWGNTQDPDSIQVVVDYVQKDTVVDCATISRWNNCPSCMVADARGGQFFTSAAAAAPTKGVGGSMARFTVVNDHLYAVTSFDLQSFDIADGLNPVKKSSQNLGWGIETIFPMHDKLFIGSTTGMFVFDISDPAQPVKQSAFQHVRSCDPVIADGNTAYVTLRSGGDICGGNINKMEILDITNIKAPALVKTMAMSNPHGLSKDGNRLFVCDGTAGLKVYDAANDRSPKLVETITGLGTTYDVIAHNGVALVVSDRGMFQYDYRAAGGLRLLHTFNLN